MDNYFTRGGRPGDYTLNEFCTPGNHDPDGNTFQTAAHNQSCWSTIAAHPRRAAIAPATPGGGQPAIPDPTFQDAVGDIRIVLVMDTSGSMADDRRMDFAKSAAGEFIDFVRDGDAIGIVSFADSAFLNSDLTPMNAGTRATAKATVNSFTPFGNTNITDGLRLALLELTANPDRSCSEIIVLLTDGEHNTGPPPETFIPNLQDEGVTVFTVGVGTSIPASGESSLVNLATQTGGIFLRVSDASELPAIFTRLAAESTGGGLLARAPLPILPNQTAQATAQVEDAAATATFVMAFSEPSDQFTFSLRAPGGTLITQQSLPPNVTFISGTNSKSFRVQNPQAGAWNLIVTAGPAVAGRVETLTFIDNNNVSLSAGTEKDRVTAPEPVRVQVTPQYTGRSVVGASIQGTATRPDGSKVPFPVYDDGLRSHGDAVAADGIYSGLFNNYTQSGTYAFDFVATTTAGSASTFGGEELFTFTLPNITPVPSFTRTVTTSAVVSGVNSGDINGDSRVDCADLTIVRTAFGKRQGQPGFDTRADVVQDGLIDINDLAFVASKLPQGLSCP